MKLRTATMAAVAVLMVASAGCERQSPYEADPALQPVPGPVAVTYPRPNPSLMADQVQLSNQIKQAQAAAEPTSAAPTAATPATPAAPAEPALSPQAQTALDVVQLLRDNKFAEVYAMFDARTKERLTLANLEMAWRTFTRNLGNLVECEEPQADKSFGASTPVKVLCHFEGGDMEITVSLNPQNQMTAPPAMNVIRPQDRPSQPEPPAAPPEPTPPAPPASTSQPGVMGAASRALAQQAAQIAQLAISGDFKAVHARLGAAVAAQASAETLQQAWTSQTAQLGKFQESAIPMVRPPQGELTTVDVPVRFEKGTVLVSVVFNPANQIAGLWINPAPPAGATLPAPTTQPRPQPAPAAQPEPSAGAGGVQGILDAARAKLRRPIPAGD